MFSLNPIAALKAEAKAEILKADPQVHAQILAIETDLTVVATFISHFTAADVSAILALLPTTITAKIPATLQTDFASALAGLPAKVAAAEAGLAALDAALK